MGISQYITHKSLDATRKGFVEELIKQGYVDGEEIEIDYQNAQGEQRNLKNISNQLSGKVILYLPLRLRQHKVSPIQAKRLL